MKTLTIRNISYPMEQAVKHVMSKEYEPTHYIRPKTYTQALEHIVRDWWKVNQPSKPQELEE